MANLEELLKKVSEIVVKEKTQQEERRKRGENFNIFKVLGLSTSEVRLHSAFLAELLNPKGEHGLGSKFLEAFVDDIVSDENKFPFECESAKVYVELDIGPIRNDETEGGRIDIYIQDASKQTIVVENKIYAGDQFKQMLRYYNYVTKNEHLDYEKNQFRLLYLTLDEHVPSRESTGNNKVVESSIKCINYKENILTWLERCIEISALYPAIREIISQYVTNIKQIMSIMSEENKSSIISLLIKESNIEATLAIYHLSSEIGNTIRLNFIQNKLAKLATDNNMEMIFDEAFPLLPSGRSQKYKNIRFILPEFPNVCFQIEQENNAVYYGICAGGYAENERIVLEQFEDWSDGINKNWPYGSKWFPGNYKYWDGKDALEDMVKGNQILNIIETELKRVKDRKLLEKLDKELSDRKKI